MAKKNKPDRDSEKPEGTHKGTDDLKAQAQISKAKKAKHKTNGSKKSSVVPVITKEDVKNEEKNMAKSDNKDQSSCADLKYHPTLSKEEAKKDREISNDLEPLAKEPVCSKETNVPSPNKRQKTTKAPDSNWKKLIDSGQVQSSISKGKKCKKASKPVQVEDKQSPTEKSKSIVLKRQVNPNAPVTQVIALDCEFVEAECRSNALGRVSVVNYMEDVLFDSFVKVDGKVLDYRTRWSGIRAKDLVGEHALEFKEVQERVDALIKGRIVVGHAIHNDFKALLLSHPKVLIRDTQKYKAVRQKASVPEASLPSLRVLAHRLLSLDIQNAEHDSTEDAIVALRIYKQFAKQWEAEFKPKKGMLAKR